MKIGRNDPCHCGSGKKYKACHLAADEAAERQARAKGAEAKADAPAETATAAAPRAGQRHATKQPWKGGQANTRGFARVSATRKVGSG